MQPKFTLKQWGRFAILAPMLVAMLCLFTGDANAQQYVNGVLSTGPTANSGAAAPGGTTWSECQNPTGDLTIANTNAGYSAQVGSAFSVADDFTVPGGSWNLTKITVYAYSTGFSGAVSPFNDLRLQIHNSNPMSGPTTIVFGDLTTNRLSSSTNSNVFRIFNTVVAPATPAATNRIVWKLEANVAVTLPAGTYWIEYQTGTAQASNFTPNSAPVGVRTLPGYNALQKNGTSWATAVDAGQGPASPSNVNVDFPFIIDYTTGPCAGTPAPGNTIASATTVCPAINFTLSLENGTAGSGVTYQWQSASAIGGPYTDIPGATSSTYNTTISATTFFQATVTCSGNTGTSTPVQVTLNPPSACYCLPPGSDCTDSDVITRVRISTLDNASTCDAGPPAGYGNYLALGPTDVFAGAANAITVDVPVVWPESVAVWIDYNQNGQFEGTEYTLVGDNNSGGTITNNINIPNSALPGNTRMRVRVQFFTVLGPNDACLGFTFGETEDYTVNIVPCVPVTVTTNPSNTSVACGSNATFTVATAGSLPAYGWEYRASASAPWQIATNNAIFSDATTSTLTLNNVPSTYNGYQFRALVSGGCSAIDFSTTATLTVTQIVPVVTPSSATICVGTIQQLSLTNTLGNVTMFSEGFDQVAPLPAGWASQNNSSPVGLLGWFQGNPAVFPSHSGTPESYIASNFNAVGGANTISNWLMTPEVNMKNGDVFKFWTRKNSGSTFPDRMEVRLSTAGPSTNVGATNSSVGDFTTLLLTINPSLTTTDYPDSWTEYTVTVTGITGTVGGRFAFRYFVPNAGPAGVNSDFIGIDDVSFTSAGGTAQGIWTGTAGTMWTDAGATVAYVPGTPATTIYVNPTVTTSYSVSYTTPTPCTSATTVVPVNVVDPITAAVDPVNTEACLGGTASFSVSASGGPIGYQWQVSTNGGVTWTNIAAATGSTLNVTGVTQLMHNNLYRAVLTAAPCAGSVTTASASLSVNELPVVTLTASDPTLAPGQSTTLTATSSPAAAPNGWSWTMDHSPIPGTSNTQVVDFDGFGTYQASVVDVNGCESSSNEVVIGAEASDKLWIYPNPTQGQFQVRLFYGSEVAERRVLTIYNQLGQVITSKHFDLVAGASPYLRMDFDLGHVPRGIYVVKVAHQFTGKVVSGLVIVE